VVKAYGWGTFLIVCIVVMTTLLDVLRPILTRRAPTCRWC
jgi:hypothetical protein